MKPSPNRRKKPITVEINLTTAAMESYQLAQAAAVGKSTLSPPPPPKSQLTHASSDFDHVSPVSELSTSRTEYPPLQPFIISAPMGASLEDGLDRPLYEQHFLDPSIPFAQIRQPEQFYQANPALRHKNVNPSLPGASSAEPFQFSAPLLVPSSTSPGSVPPPASYHAAVAELLHLLQARDGDSSLLLRTPVWYRPNWVYYAGGKNVGELSDPNEAAWMQLSQFYHELQCAFVDRSTRAHHHLASTFNSPKSAPVTSMAQATNFSSPTVPTDGEPIKRSKPFKGEANGSTAKPDHTDGRARANDDFDQLRDLRRTNLEAIAAKFVESESVPTSVNELKAAEQPTKDEATTSAKVTAESPQKVATAVEVVKKLRPSQQEQASDADSASKQKKKKKQQQQTNDPSHPVGSHPLSLLDVATSSVDLPPTLPPSAVPSQPPSLPSSAAPSMPGSRRPSLPSSDADSESLPPSLPASVAPSSVHSRRASLGSSIPPQVPPAMTDSQMTTPRSATSKEDDEPPQLLPSTASSTLHSRRTSMTSDAAPPNLPPSMPTSSVASRRPSLPNDKAPNLSDDEDDFELDIELPDNKSARIDGHGQLSESPAPTTSDAPSANTTVEPFVTDVVDVDDNDSQSDHERDEALRQLQRVMEAALEAKKVAEANRKAHRSSKGTRVAAVSQEPTGDTVESVSTSTGDVDAISTPAKSAAGKLDGDSRWNAARRDSATLSAEKVASLTADRRTETDRVKELGVTSNDKARRAHQRESNEQHQRQQTERHSQERAVEEEQRPLEQQHETEEEAPRRHEEKKLGLEEAVAKATQSPTQLNEANSSVAAKSSTPKTGTPVNESTDFPPPTEPEPLFTPQPASSLLSFSKLLPPPSLDSVQPSPRPPVFDSSSPPDSSRFRLGLLSPPDSARRLYDSTMDSEVESFVASVDAARFERIEELSARRPPNRFELLSREVFGEKSIPNTFRADVEDFDQGEEDGPPAVPIIFERSSNLNSPSIMPSLAIEKLISPSSSPSSLQASSPYTPQPSKLSAMIQSLTSPATNPPPVLDESTQPAIMEHRSPKPPHDTAPVSVSESKSAPVIDTQEVTANEKGSAPSHTLTPEDAVVLSPISTKSDSPARSPSPKSIKIPIEDEKPKSTPSSAQSAEVIPTDVAPKQANDDTSAAETIPPPVDDASSQTEPAEAATQSPIAPVETLPVQPVQSVQSVHPSDNLSDDDDDDDDDVDDDFDLSSIDSIELVSDQHESSLAPNEPTPVVPLSNPQTVDAAVNSITIRVESPSTPAKSVEAPIAVGSSVTAEQSEVRSLWSEVNRDESSSVKVEEAPPPNADVTGDTVGDVESDSELFVAPTDADDAVRPFTPSPMEAEHEQVIPVDGNPSDDAEIVILGDEAETNVADGDHEDSQDYSTSSSDEFYREVDLDDDIPTAIEAIPEGEEEVDASDNEAVHVKETKVVAAPPSEPKSASPPDGEPQPSLTTTDNPTPAEVTPTTPFKAAPNESSTSNPDVASPKPTLTLDVATETPMKDGQHNSDRIEMYNTPIAASAATVASFHPPTITRTPSLSVADIESILRAEEIASLPLTVEQIQAQLREEEISSLPQPVSTPKSLTVQQIEEQLRQAELAELATKGKSEESNAHSSPSVSSPSTLGIPNTSAASIQATPKSLTAAEIENMLRAEELAALPPPNFDQTPKKKTDSNQATTSSPKPTSPSTSSSMTTPARPTNSRLSLSVQEIEAVLLAEEIAEMAKRQTTPAKSKSIQSENDIASPLPTSPIGPSNASLPFTPSNSKPVTATGPASPSSASSVPSVS